MDLRPAQPHEAEAIRSLLRDNELPIDDLGTARIEFLVAVDDAGLVGVGGIEAYGEAGLLRSLAVRLDRRGDGVGARLVEALETHARRSALRELALLTTTAAPFFAARGYRRIGRETMPAALQESAEFRALCPASAVCMSKPLGDSAS